MVKFVKYISSSYYLVVMKLGIWGLVFLSFVAGMLTTHLIQHPQVPSSAQAAEKASPQDWVSEKDIHIYDDKIELAIPDARWATFADTNSMDPLLDAGSNGIQVIPSRPEQLAIGDVVTYNYKGRKIIHRIVDIQQDAEGYLFTLKGDNNLEPDPVKVRFNDIERVLVAVVY